MAVIVIARKAMEMKEVTPSALHATLFVLPAIKKKSIFA
jgi:hypothetical protein